MKSLIGTMMILAVALPLGARGEEPNSNFFRNPGFEQNFSMTIGKWYGKLREAGVMLPAGEEASMPTGTLLLVADGWEAAGNEFEYVKGTPGQEVHSGQYAIRVTASREVRLMVGSGWPVGDNKELGHSDELLRVSKSENWDNNLIQRGKKYAIGFYAKGIGEVAIVVCPFNDKAEWMPGEKDPQGEVMLMVNHGKTGPFKVESADGWTQYHGVLQILSESVKTFRFVVQIKGQISLDDISLTPISSETAP